MERFMRFGDIISEAAKLARPIEPSDECSAATVASAIISGLGNIYTGVCTDFRCGIGFCAEHAAVAEMLKHRESKISVVVAVTDRGEVISPCGRCREMMWQLDPSNREALVVLAADWALPLRELLPYR
jgi:cytidine deaminase